jgi:hypothetical protein
MKPAPVRLDSAPDLLRDTLFHAEQSQCALMEIELHLKDAQARIKDLLNIVRDFRLR